MRERMYDPHGIVLAVELVHVYFKFSRFEPLPTFITHYLVDALCSCKEEQVFRAHIASWCGISGRVLA